MHRLLLIFSQPGGSANSGGRLVEIISNFPQVSHSLPLHRYIASSLIFRLATDYDAQYPISPVTTGVTMRVPASPRLAESEGQDEDSLAARARGLAHSKVKIRNFESEADLSPPPLPPARPVPFAPSSQPCRGGLKVCGCGWVPSYSHPRLIPTHPLHPVGPVQATPARSFFRRLPHCLI